MISFIPLKSQMFSIFPTKMLFINCFCFIIVCCWFNTFIVDCKIIPKKLDNYFFTLDLNMPGILPQKNDDYYCTAKNVSSEELYITQFEPNADATKIHHMIIFGCENVLSRAHIYPKSWSCMQQLCNGMKILYAWGRNAPTLTLPKDVGFHIGRRSKVNFLVLQAHYAHPLAEKDSSGIRLLYTLNPQPYVAGIFLMASLSGVIPPNKQVAHVDINCRLDRSPINIFAYRVHAHALGKVVTGYKYSDNDQQWTLIAKGNPQWPQAFYPMEKIISLKKDDIVYARCTFDSSNRSHMTPMGPTANDEMCNLYLMYYSENLLPDIIDSGDSVLPYSTLYSRRRMLQDTCEDLQIRDVPQLPVGNDVPLPRNVTLEEYAKGQNSIHSAVHHHHQMNNNKQDIIELIQHDSWPFGNDTFGQITAIDIDSNGNIVIFHRGSHVWNELSFDLKNHFKQIDKGPISEPTIIVIDPHTKTIVDKWGSDLFYLPHGLTVDRSNIWLTDVALHQVFKFSLDPTSIKFKKPMLTLGERFVPGVDLKHFCKPTSVAVDVKTNDFYVADGYCNSRIIRFNEAGVEKNRWGHSIVPSELFQPVQPPNAFSIPHKITLVDYSDDEQLACVADRENGRIQCFITPFGLFKFQIKIPQFNDRLFSITYSSTQRILYAVCGPSLIDPKKDISAFAFDIESQKLIAIFTPKSGTFSQPHDIAVSNTDGSVFVVEIGPNNIWMFTRSDLQQTHQSINSNSKTVDNQTISEKSIKSNVIKAKIIESSIYTTTVANMKSDSSRFSLKLLQIRSKEFRDAITFNQLLFVVLFLLLLFVIVTNLRYCRHNNSPMRFCCALFDFFTVSFRRRRKYFANGVSGPSSSEKIDLGSIFSDRNRKLKKSGFNRLPLNEEESELQSHSDDDDDDGDLSDVLEDFNLTRSKQGIV